MGEGTALGRVRGLGSAHHGSHHWLLQRFTAAGNLLTLGYVVFSFLLLPELSYESVHAWLGALAGGARSYEAFTWFATTIPGYVVLVGLSWAFFNHFCSGIRHFVLDIGAGYEVDANNRWSVVTTAGGIVLTAAFWAALMLL